MTFPKDVVSWARNVFAAGNERVSSKLDQNPNLPEESLDFTWVEHLSQYSTAQTLSSDWTVQIETHFLGGMRHWGNWEIADIGLLLFADLGPGNRLSKVALLQSKRLYPTTGAVEEETMGDYIIGFGRLADPEELKRPLSLARDFTFTDECRYGALSAGSDQIDHINEYQEKVGLKVYYQFYNPRTLPFTQRIPLRGEPSKRAALTHGVRVVEAAKIHSLLSGKAAHYRPTVADLAKISGLDESLGWRLESFIADEWLGCREGDKFETVGDAPIQRLFNRRSGPISAAVSIRVQSPDAAG